MNTRAITGPLLVMALALASNAAAVAGSDDEPRAALTTATDAAAAAAAEGRGHLKKMMLNPYMLIPQLITLGFAPIVLANLKMMVMSALTINNMALNAAIFMLVRNMVFGPRPKIKYVNHGYKDHHHVDDHYVDDHHLDDHQLDDHHLDDHHHQHPSQHHHSRRRRRRQHAEPTSDHPSHPQPSSDETLQNERTDVPS